MFSSKLKSPSTTANSSWGHKTTTYILPSTHKCE